MAVRSSQNLYPGHTDVIKIIYNFINLQYDRKLVSPPGSAEFEICGCLPGREGLLKTKLLAL